MVMSCLSRVMKQLTHSNVKLQCRFQQIHDIPTTAAALEGQTLHSPSHVFTILQEISLSRDIKLGH